ncbi:MAG TPA: NAD(+)/NADH kinase [Gaiellaceae bacterium]|nr:NAD(+)/NADH kinase [Gaiellaceae bacterium]
MTSTAGSTTPSARAVARAAVVTHGKPSRIGPALARLRTVAREASVELLISADEAEKHALVEANGDVTEADIAVVLGGDGTMLRALTRFLGTGVPVIGVNFGRVGFLSSIARRELESGLTRVFAGEFHVVELPTLDVEVGEERRVAVNDALVASAQLGRMVELNWSIGGEDLGNQPCDGILCSTPSGSTAYNLSNGGPVLIWGIDAMAITFVAPHSLHARPFVVPRGRDVVVWNRTPDVPVAVLVDGHEIAEPPPGGRIVVRLGRERSLLATLPEATFVRRYRQSFAS